MLPSRLRIMDPVLLYSSTQVPTKVVVVTVHWHLRLLLWRCATYSLLLLRVYPTPHTRDNTNDPLHYTPSCARYSLVFRSRLCLTTHRLDAVLQSYSSELNVALLWEDLQLRIGKWRSRYVMIALALCNMQRSTGATTGNGISRVFCILSAAAALQVGVDGGLPERTLLQGVGKAHTMGWRVNGIRVAP